MWNASIHRTCPRVCKRHGVLACAARQLALCTNNTRARHALHGTTAGHRAFSRRATRARTRPRARPHATHRVSVGTSRTSNKRTTATAIHNSQSSRSRVFEKSGKKNHPRPSGAYALGLGGDPEGKDKIINKIKKLPPTSSGAMVRS